MFKSTEKSGEVKSDEIIGCPFSKKGLPSSPTPARLVQTALRCVACEGAPFLLVVHHALFFLFRNNRLFRPNPDPTMCVLNVLAAATRRTATHTQGPFCAKPRHGPLSVHRPIPRRAESAPDLTCGQARRGDPELAACARGAGVEPARLSHLEEGRGEGVQARREEGDEGYLRQEDQAGGEGLGVCLYQEDSRVRGGEDKKDFGRRRPPHRVRSSGAPRRGHLSLSGGSSWGCFPPLLGFLLGTLWGRPAGSFREPIWGESGASFWLIFGARLNGHP